MTPKLPTNPSITQPPSALGQTSTKSRSIATSQLTRCFKTASLPATMTNFCSRKDFHIHRTTNSRYGAEILTQSCSSLTFAAGGLASYSGTWIRAAGGGKYTKTGLKESLWGNGRYGPVREKMSTHVYWCGVVFREPVNLVFHVCQLFYNFMLNICEIDGVERVDR